MSNPNTRKTCVVPKCKNTTTNSPDKLFFIVPKDGKMRKKWIKAMKRLDPFGDKSTVYCCEDHFDVENDMENYTKYKLVGGIIKLKPGTVPHKFKCQQEKEGCVSPLEMPRRTLVTDNQLKAARLLISKGTSIRKAADEVGLNESTLRSRLKIGKTAKSMGRFSATFTKAQEDEIYQYLKQSEDLTMERLRKYVYEYAELNKIPHRFNTSTKLAGRDWAYGFLRRYSELKSRLPSFTSSAKGEVTTKTLSQDPKNIACSDTDEENEEVPFTYEEEPEILNIKFEVDEESFADQLQENPLENGSETKNYQQSASVSNSPEPSTFTHPPAKRRRSTSPFTSSTDENLQVLSERLLAIEESRIETDKELARAMNRQASALEELLGLVKHFVNIYERDHNSDPNYSNNKNI